MATEKGEVGLFFAGLVVGAAAAIAASRWWRKRFDEAMDEPVIALRESGLL